MNSTNTETPKTVKQKHVLIRITLETLKITLIHHNIDVWNANHFEYTFSMFFGNLKVCQILE